LQEPATFLATPDPEIVARAVGLSAADLDAELRPQFVATGVPQLIVPIADAGALERAAAQDAGELAALIASGDAVVVYLAVVGEDGHGHARSFLAEGPQVVEDPASGSAVGPLCAYLARYAGIGAIVIEQGEQAGRPSRLDARIEGDRVRVGGQAVVVMTGEVTL
jgi:trans-2,3-dihydro-3-hydroxyanthranilate isomerase